MKPGRGRSGEKEFSMVKKSARRTRLDLAPLHAKIGQLALENDFLEGALTKAGLLSAKR